MSAHLEFHRVTQSTRSPTMAHAIISGQTEQWFFLQTSQGELRARCAVSCLIAPEIGDTVLLSVSEDPMSSYILSILLRPEADHSVLNIPGGATFKTAQGQLVIQATAISMKSQQSLNLDTATLTVQAQEAEVRLSRLLSWIEQAETLVSTIKLVAKNITTTVERRILKAKESFKWIEQVDETRAGRVRMDIEGRFQMQSRHTSIKSEGLVAIDGKKINLG